MSKLNCCNKERRNQNQQHRQQSTETTSRNVDSFSRRRLLKTRPNKQCRLICIIMNCVLATVGLFLALIGLAITHGSRTVVFGRVLEVLRHETSIQSVRPFALICVVMGILMILISAFGAISTALDNQVLIIIYLLTIMFTTAFQILFLIILIIHRQSVRDFLEFILRQLHILNNDGWKYAKIVLRELQRTFRCCGIQKPDDLSEFNLTCLQPNHYKNGCMIKITSFFNRNMISTIVICSLFFIFQMIAVVTSGGTLLMRS
ncbi:hypothetical protein GJ496_010311 [Pomphorhynchus laevis]|nr:hypothetical protein GJ496_010311 [Pomphorhynchus laevis]